MFHAPEALRRTAEGRPLTLRGDRDMLERVGRRLCAVAAAVDCLACPEDRAYFAAELEPLLLEWQVLAADAGLISLEPANRCHGFVTGALVAAGAVTATVLIGRALLGYEARVGRRLRSIVKRMDKTAITDWQCRAALREFEIEEGFGGVLRGAWNAAKFVARIGLIVGTATGIVAGATAGAQAIAKYQRGRK